MQDRAAERRFYADLFARNPDNEHITGGYDELHRLALGAAPDGTVLDVGCGTGAHTVRLAQRGCDVIALDITLEGVRAARERLRAQGLRARFVVADAEWLPLRDSVAGVTWAFLFVHHFPTLDRLPGELSRVTRSRIVALEPNANNVLTWLANNVVNRFVGTDAMTPNQRALRPGKVTRAFRRVGFAPVAVHFIDRRWSDGFGWIRRAYDLLTRWLPQRFRANKFLVVLERRA
jgi:SAM-dependent methyltransferase